MSTIAKPPSPTSIDQTLPEKTPHPLTPTTHPIPLGKDGQTRQEAGDLTFIVDLSSASGSRGSAKGKDKKDIANHGEHALTNTSTNNQASPKPLLPLKTKSGPTVVPESCMSDSESVCSPIEPPGLREDASAPSAQHTAEASCYTPAAVPDVHEKASEGTVAEPWGDTDAVFDIDTTLFEEDLSGYSLTDLPKLDTFIPDDLLPDDLLVHDIDNLTGAHSPSTSSSSRGTSDMPVRYVRILPITKRPAEESAAKDAFSGRDPNAPPRSAHLYLKRSNRLGTGNHSFVWRAPLRLRLDPASQERSVVTVAAKTAHGECGAHFMLHKEARVYNALPRSYMEDVVPAPPAAACEKPESSTGCASTVSADGASKDSTGALSPPQAESDAHAANCLGPAVPPPAPSETTAAAPAEQACARPTKAEPAVVPKFYGYYAALSADGKVISHSHRDVGCAENDTCGVKWPTRILLVEECGQPISPYRHTPAQRCVHWLVG